jgi:hypothetical protein
MQVINALEFELPDPSIASTEFIEKFKQETGVELPDAVKEVFRCGFQSGAGWMFGEIESRMKKATNELMLLLAQTGTKN